MTQHNGAVLTDPVTGPVTALVADSFTALTVLLSTVDKNVRWLADQLIADSNPERVLWYAVNYAARVYPHRVVSTEAVRQAIFAELDDLHMSIPTLIGGTHAEA
ncbi:hypothetical protein [Mycolicibacterium elephantis]